MFPKLEYLNYHPSDLGYECISFENFPTSIFSSTLLELHIKVLCLRDCLHLLDGRFNHLRIFNVKIISSIPFILKTYKVNFEKFENNSFDFFLRKRY
jgi:hypothetical protein